MKDRQLSSVIAPEWGPGHRVEKTCLGCGRRFIVYLSWSSRKYCSRACNPHFQHIRFKKTCDYCGQAFQARYPERRFCRDSCKIAWLAETFSGQNSPHWRGGSIENYGRNWGRISRQIMQRDNGVCFLCGLDTNLVVHHFIPFRFLLENFGRQVAETSGHNPVNLITLCRSCHMKAEHHAENDWNVKEVGVWAWLNDKPLIPLDKIEERDYSREWA